MKRVAIIAFMALGFAACGGESSAPTAPPATATRVIALTGNLGFGNVPVGSTSTATLTISNSGSAALAVSGVSLPSGFSRNWAGGTIAAGASQAVTVTFAPTASTNYAGTVAVTSDATSGTNTIPVSGTGTSASTRVVGLSGNLAFGNVPVGSSATSILTISNSGNATLTVSAITASGGMSSVLLADWLSGTIAAGTSRQVTIQFAPSASQAYSGVITVVSDATSGTNTISVSGTGTAVTPTPVPGFYLLGGPGYSQFLGFFTCVFCVEFHANSVNNQFGQYGSQFSSTSIRNQFSQYGSAFSTYSACNQFAGSPPRVYNSNGSVYYGELTLNQVRLDAIKTSTIVTWLTTNVCKH